MNRKDAAEYVKSRYADYLRPAKKKGTFICPVCGNGTGADGDGICLYTRSKNPYTLHCFRCNTTGSIVDFYQKEHNCSTAEAFNGLYEYFGLNIENRGEKSTAEERKEPQRITTPTGAEMPAEGEITPLEDKADYTAYYQTCRQHITDENARNYLALRGISEQTAAAHRIGYDPQADPASNPGAMGDEYRAHPCPRLIIPVSKGFYIARRVDGIDKYKAPMPKGSHAAIFNEKAIYNEAGQPVFITEGAIDALSIIEVGAQAAATNGAGNYNLLLQALEKKRTDNTIVLCRDKDAAGENWHSNIVDGLKRLNISYITADIAGSYKDPNEALTSDRGAFIEAIGEAERKTSKPDNTADYIRRGMGAEIIALSEQATRKTGFSNLDAEVGSIYAGLYVVGGVSSVGKTTFISQLADQLAEQGQHVLFFSMEQSRLEMVSKSIARQTARIDQERAVSSLQIRTGAGNMFTREMIDDATTAYIEAVQDRISVIEGNLACTVSYIGNYARQYIAKNGGIRPVIVIDYLQILQPEIDPETGRKPTDPRQIVDYNITQLKRLSRELEIPVFAVSSVNRTNYLQPIDFESFKESGAIEFTADVVWGLQLACIHESIFDKANKVKEKRERIAEAKAEIPRAIELVCLKNRYGKSRYAAQFKYLPQYDYFEPITEDTNSKYTAFDKEIRRI